MGLPGLRFAHDSDKTRVVHFLQESGLPFADITLKPPQVFVLLEQGDDLLGTGGLEIYDGVALLRSICVAAAMRSHGIGKQILERLLQMARDKSVHDIFLLTTTAPDYFRKLGFTQVNRADAPPAIQASAEFRHLCADTALCFSLGLKQ